MTTTTQSGSAIVAGYEWRQRITVSAAVPPFPEGVALTAHVRATLASDTVLATLSTAAGSIERVDDDSIDLIISGAASVSWSDTVVLDCVRTDTDPDSYLGFQMAVPVVQPVTRGL